MRIVRTLATQIFLTTVLGTAVAPLTAQAPTDAPVQVDRLFEDWSTVESPGCAVAVAEKGLTVLSRAYGMADLEHGIPNTPGTIFEGGSLSKQFTSAAIVLLALDGKLSLDDDVRAYLPEVPDYGHVITLHHLMTHTSGLRDWGSVAEISGWGREERSHGHADVLDIVSRQSALNYEPGHEYSYTNTGYNLLAMIVDRVSGMSFAEFSRKRIFEPLGMTHTQWRDDYRRIVPDRSTAYDARADGTWAINRPIENVHGNGGILTTVGDLTIWNQALDDARFGPEFMRMMLRQGKLNDGSTIIYAGGLQVGSFAGVPSVTHTGATAGYRAFLGRYPEQGLSVAMLCNASNINRGVSGGRIARIFLGGAARDDAAPEGVRVSADALRRLAGLYREPVSGDPMRLSVEDGALRMDGRATLIPVGDGVFQVGSADRRFVVEPTPGGRPRIRVEGWEYTRRFYEPVDDFAPGEEDLQGYAGTYHSHDAETTYVVKVEDGALVTWQRPNTTHTLEPVYPDAFESDSGGIIRFRRDDTGAVTALSLSFPRVFDMRFDKVDGR
ncbi:MAG: beta-lactamase family protein [Gemmatimonadota bacterium]|nr:beta-lactamase family protein [Gemmatimonadota bacterium]